MATITVAASVAIAIAATTRLRLLISSAICILPRGRARALGSHGGCCALSFAVVEIKIEEVQLVQCRARPNTETLSVVACIH
jgi:hypothetical protein